MLKKIIKKIIGIRLIANTLIIISLKLHNFLYKFSSILAIELNNGIHPKHRIIKYKEWFLDEILKDDVVLDTIEKVNLQEMSLKNELFKKSPLICQKSGVRPN